VEERIRPMYETDGAIMPFRPFTADPYQRPPRWPLLRNRPRALRHAASCHMPPLSLSSRIWTGALFHSFLGTLAHGRLVCAGLHRCALPGTPWTCSAAALSPGLMHPPFRSERRRRKTSLQLARLLSFM
jgi:hypothetical protein